MLSLDTGAIEPQNSAIDQPNPTSASCYPPSFLLPCFVKLLPSPGALPSISTQTISDLSTNLEFDWW